MLVHGLTWSKTSSWLHDTEDGDLNDDWCEEHEAVRQEQQLLRQRQDAVEMKLDQIMGAMQKLSVQHAPSIETKTPAVNGGGDGEDANL